jgi:glycosyltransferase involved in cell wall biosynthesis
MKILIPFFMTDEHNLDSPHVSGGIERFIQLIYQNFPGEIIPFYYNDEDRKKRLTNAKLAQAIIHHNPDVLMVNFDSTALIDKIQDTFNIPIAWISRTAAGGISKVLHVEMMKEFLEKGGTLSMVSPWQYVGMDKLSRRINGIPLDLNGGYINAAFCNGDEPVYKDLEYDITTIARMNKTKNPYLNHKLSHPNQYRSLILTTTSNLVTSENIHYHKINSHWNHPQETIENLPHAQVMEKLAKSSTYFSTCPAETWGITALEALARGLPVIVSTDTTGTHASECIPASPDHIVKVRNNIRPDKFKEPVDNLLKLDYNKRIEISELTKQKHSKENWVKSLQDLFEQTIDRKKKVKETSVFDFFE